MKSPVFHKMMRSDWHVVKIKGTKGKKEGNSHKKFRMPLPHDSQTIKQSVDEFIYFCSTRREINVMTTEIEPHNAHQKLLYEQLVTILFLCFCNQFFRWLMFVFKLHCVCFQQLANRWSCWKSVLCLMTIWMLKQWPNCSHTSFKMSDNRRTITCTPCCNTSFDFCKCAPSTTKPFNSTWRNGCQYFSTW